jgi:hypothetical protein
MNAWRITGWRAILSNPPFGRRLGFALTPSLAAGWTTALAPNETRLALAGGSFTSSRFVNNTLWRTDLWVAEGNLSSNASWRLVADDLPPVALPSTPKSDANAFLTDMGYFIADIEGNTSSTTMGFIEQSSFNGKGTRVAVLAVGGDW